MFLSPCRGAIFAKNSNASMMVLPTYTLSEDDAKPAYPEGSFLPRICENDDFIPIYLTTSSGWMRLRALTRDA